MTLRTTAIIAGVLGLLMLVAGLIADAARADRQVVTEQALDTPVVVLGPEVLALPGLERIAINAEGGLEANTARPVDAEAWIKRRSATYVLGYAGWDALATRTEERVVVTPSPTVSPSADATASPSAEPTDEPTASPEATADDATFDVGSTDVWRHSWHGVDRVAVTGSTLAVGESLVVYADSGQPLTSIEFYAQRQVNDGWIAPLIWIGAALAALGLVALVSGLIDIRPLQARAETWRRKRGAADEPPRPGSRRERRLAGSTLPEVSLDEPEEATSAAPSPFTTNGEPS